MFSGTVYRRETPSGASSWVAHATWQEGGKRRQAKRSFRTKKAAQAALTELLAAHQTGTFVAPSRMVLRDFVEPWLDGLANQGRKPTTLQGYRKTLNAYVLPRLGDVALQELRASDLDAMYADLLRSGGRGGRPLSMTTVHHAHAAINKLLHDAERRPINASSRRRHPTTRQKRVVMETHRHECVDCQSTDLLELDHNPSFEQTGRTVTHELEPRCAPCHRARHRARHRHEQPRAQRRAA